MSCELTAGALRGRAFQREDWPLIVTAARRAPDEPPANADDGRRLGERFVESWLSQGYGPYLWRLGGAPIGYAGLTPSREPGAPEVELVFAVTPERRGRGYACAAAAAALSADGPRPGDAWSVAAWTRPGDAAAAHILGKLGFVFERPARWAGAERRVYRRPTA